MSNFKSLESIIRDKMFEAFKEAEGTIKRRNVKMVARPEDAKPNDEKSTLGRTAEYKTKVIDERKKLEKEDDNFDADYNAQGERIQAMLDKDKSDFDAKRAAPSTSPSVPATPVSSTPDTPASSSAKIGIGPDDQGPVDKFFSSFNKRIVKEKYGKGYVSPASKIEKAMAAKGVAPDSTDKHRAEMERLDKEYEKIKAGDKKVNEAAVPTGDVETTGKEDGGKGNVAKDKKKKGAESDLDDAGEIKGGKTEVVLNPTTDDSISDDSRESESSRKARKKANAEIGQKGAPIKEEVISEAYASKSTAHTLAKKLTSGFMHKPKYHADGSATITTNDKGGVKSHHYIDSHLKHAGFDFNHPTKTYDNHTQSAHGHTVTVQRVSPSSHTLHIRSNMKEAANLGGHETTDYEGPYMTLGPDGKQGRHKELAGAAVRASARSPHANKPKIKESLDERMHSGLEGEIKDVSPTAEPKSKSFGSSKTEVKIGAKIKEDTQMNNIGKKFGVSDAMVEAAKAILEMKGKCPKCGKTSCMCESVDKNDPFDGVKTGQEKKIEKSFVADVAKMKKKEGMKEELVGNQKKLDKNHNGRLDKQDFKILRNKKKMEEEVEQVNEASKSSMAKPKSYSDTMKKAPTFSSSNIAKMERDEKARQSKQAFGDMFGGGNPAGNLRVKKEEVEFSEAEIARIEAIAKEIK